MGAAARFRDSWRRCPPRGLAPTAPLQVEQVAVEREGDGSARSPLPDVLFHLLVDKVRR